MGASLRTAAGSRNGIPRQPAGRSSTLRQPSALSAVRGIPDRAGAASPADSVSTTATGVKRKERDFESDAGGGGGGSEETNINVVVRCRGRSEREVKENSTVVVQADGVKGSAVGLLLGPNSLSNKSYAFDRVYSAAADQVMVFDDTVRPILDEVCGSTCTRIDCLLLTNFADACWIQLHNLCVRPDRHGENIHHVGGYDRDARHTLGSSGHHSSCVA